jgi:inorganic pyrophosphatase/exopolyphosphatase
MGRKTRVVKIARCCFCERPTSGSLEFCREHYQDFKEDIKSKKPWVRVLKNEAQRERRRTNREFDNASLDAIIDHEWSRRY